MPARVVRSIASAGAAVVLLSALMMGGASVASAATGALHASSHHSGVWPGVGQICGSGPGGASSVRGVSDKSINVTVFTDANNTVQPGLDGEFPQFAKAFAKWCNAAGGIQGRHINVDVKDAALFNAAQVTNEACQSDFMSVGGGLVLDTAAVPVRVNCGLGQITSFTVSNESVSAKLQVNPNGVNNSEIEAGWYGALGKKYPKAIKHFGIGGSNQSAILEQIHKDEQAAVAQGYKVVDFQTPPLNNTNWTPYIDQAQSKGVQALQPSASSNVGPYFQAMQTAGYNPAFVYMYENLYVKATAQATASMKLPPTYLSLQLWPFELAKKSPGLTQLIKVMHTYAHGTAIDQNDELAASSWVLFAKSASACGSKLTVSCVLKHAAAQKNWSAGDIQAPTAQLAMSNQNPTPSYCFTMVQLKGGKFSWDKSLTKPNNKIWHCDKKTLFKVSANGS